METTKNYLDELSEKEMNEINGGETRVVYKYVNGEWCWCYLNY